MTPVPCRGKSGNSAWAAVFYTPAMRIDPDCCKNVIIRGCIIETGDDAVVVKTTKPMAEKYGGCENVVIHGCVMHSRDSALKIGTETHGTIRNIV